MRKLLDKKEFFLRFNWITLINRSGTEFFYDKLVIFSFHHSLSDIFMHLYGKKKHEQMNNYDRINFLNLFRYKV